MQGLSPRVVKNDPHRVAMPRPNAAHTVPEIDPIHPAATLHRPMTDRKHNSISLPERHDFHPRLHARTLFGHHEFSTGEVASRFGQQDCHL
jgi:hypothetical protein